MMRLLLSSLVLLSAAAFAADVAAPVPTPAPAGAGVYFIEPTDGAIVKQEFTVRFGLHGMGVAPAGIAHPNTGHHHLLIDVEAPPKAGEVIPNDTQHRHFGGGQTEAILTLAPGRHRLQLLLGDHMHRPHDPPVMSAPVTITVE
ncbi:MAG TPA: DUF4399 domain-containing protein [Pseudomonadota bacterium]|nr:DUF4399 domain-containing protein [Pseudomonadota bacterium]